MGCSSSSAQTVDQEKRPGTKPEETNRDTPGVRNGIVADDAKTIEDQVQLPSQTALPENLQAGAEDDGEPVLMATEAQEDLGSGEDLLTSPEPEPEPAVCEEAAPETAALAEVSAESPPVVEVLIESVQSVQAEAPTATEEEAPAADAELAPSEPAEVLLVTEAVEPPAAVAQETPAVEMAEAPIETATGAPVEVTPPAEALITNSAPEDSSETPAEVLGNIPDESSAQGEALVLNVPAEPSMAADEENILDAELAAATVPQLPLSPEVLADTQAEVLSTEGGGASTATDETEGTPEAEPDTVVEQFQDVEAASISETLLEETAASSVTSEVDTDTSVVEPSPIESEELSSPEPAAGPDQEALADGSALDQSLEEIQSEIAKKED